MGIDLRHLPFSQFFHPHSSINSLHSPSCASFFYSFHNPRPHLCLFLFPPPSSLSSSSITPPHPSSSPHPSGLLLVAVPPQEVNGNTPFQRDAGRPRPLRAGGTGGTCGWVKDDRRRRTESWRGEVAGEVFVTVKLLEGSRYTPTLPLATPI